MDRFDEARAALVAAQEVLENACRYRHGSRSFRLLWMMFRHRLDRIAFDAPFRLLQWIARKARR